LSFLNIRLIASDGIVCWNKGGPTHFGNTSKIALDILYFCGILYSVKIGVYAGSFNPFHKGHADISLQASQVFDMVVIAIGNNPDKQGVEKEPDSPLMLGSGVCNIWRFDGLLTDALKDIQQYWKPTEDVEGVFLIRGLRNGVDLAYEQNQVRFLKEIDPSLKVVYFVCDPQYEHISSSALRNLKKFSPKAYEAYT